MKIPLALLVLAMFLAIDVPNLATLDDIAVFAQRFDCRPDLHFAPKTQSEKVH